MTFIFLFIFLASVNALNPPRKPQLNLENVRRARSVDVETSGRNTTTDHMNDNEKMIHREFLLYSKIYPNKLSLLLKVGLQ